jgi:hypothetical protein
VTAGNSYVVPSTGGVTSWTVTSWSNSASTGTGQSLTMKLWRPIDATHFTAVGHDGPRSITPSVLNTFSGLSIPVKAGDVLGISPNGLGGNNGCAITAPGDHFIFSATNVPDGQSGTFANGGGGQRLNVAATIDPANTFSLGGITRDKNKGTATITTTVPNPGELAASGTGVKAAAVATTSKAVTPGAATLLIKATGKKKRKLNDTGKVKLNATITYTPTGGNPSTLSTKVKLKKNL